MERALTSDDDVLALPTRARLFEALSDLRRPASTHELAARVGRHPNSVRVNLQRLAAAGLVERRATRRPRGRPRDEWVIKPEARFGRASPEARVQLARWLARVMLTNGELSEIERTGREIGRELGPPVSGRPVVDTMRDALTTLGFDPRTERPEPGRVRYVLGTCPYRDAVRENPPAICTLHRGIVLGLLDRVDPTVELADFVPKDPYAAGCLIELAGA